MQSSLPKTHNKLHRIVADDILIYIESVYTFYTMKKDKWSYISVSFVIVQHGATAKQNVDVEQNLDKEKSCCSSTIIIITNREEVFGDFRSTTSTFVVIS